MCGALRPVPGIQKAGSTRELVITTAVLQCGKSGLGRRGWTLQDQNDKRLQGCGGDLALSCLVLSQAPCRETDTTAEMDLVPASRSGPLSGRGEAGIE